MIAGTLRRGLAALADLLLPKVCLACNAKNISTAGLCDNCNVQLLSLVALKYCPRCGATVGPNIPIRQDGCPQCPNPLPRFASVTRLGPYTDPLRGIILDLKYHRFDAMRPQLAGQLAQALTGSNRNGKHPFDLVMPVPSHWRRRLLRGCDHATMLSRKLARKLSLPLGHELVRIRNTPPQVHLSRSRRIENVRGAFTAKRNSCLQGSHVLLVDDVITTGATANESARALLAAGASKVTLAVIAKSETPRAYAEIVGNEK